MHRESEIDVWLERKLLNVSKSKHNQETRGGIPGRVLKPNSRSGVQCWVLGVQSSVLGFKTQVFGLRFRNIDEDFFF